MVCPQRKNHGLFPECDRVVVCPQRCVSPENPLKIPFLGPSRKIRGLAPAKTVPLGRTIRRSRSGEKPAKKTLSQFHGSQSEVCPRKIPRKTVVCPRLTVFAPWSVPKVDPLCVRVFWTVVLEFCMEAGDWPQCQGPQRSKNRGLSLFLPVFGALEVSPENG